MIYFHIPFCKQACHYCDFHFSTSLKYMDNLLVAMRREVGLRQDYLQDRTVHSIYFGGGTPSILPVDEIQKLIDSVAAHFEISAEAEITLEANPDDLDIDKVKALRSTPINRLSIGIQSFYEEDLKWMNRAHNAQEADASIKRVQDAGFENITCDLIYGYPLLTDEKWNSNIQRLVDLQVPHISSYSMTVEKKTALAHFIRQGKSAPIDEEQSAEQMLVLMDTLTQYGYEHYEISNFAKKGMYAQHNTNYWKGKHYLGIGPSAHSYNGRSRSWNIAHNMRYIAAVQEGQPAYETEDLGLHDRINEYIMTSLRTMWGIDMIYFEQEFGQDVSHNLMAEVHPFLSKGQMLHKDASLVLTDQGKVIADHIISQLFIL
ncbi:radical SAM family heme chaperone HemW [Parapusillimonas sp. SGNA-6]|uniref:radical SAM family heme chaperone HemW n=1 Tax=Parapedobacter sp. SGR-10 TaxID=2710879 RepID=UPI0013D720A7|nr:radical SAM family heme chaperone HemW [Parapedobacter sp. SGR-10]NGF57278.1 radical SAM family heme chaperone HemW [Parapedobacter sp. SGR-10]NGM89163.1 radical SAM family heme chaperone HemW [Parapusillimonas sp. SGNA-6]